MAALHHVTAGTVTTIFSDQEADPQMALPRATYIEYDRRPGLSLGVYQLDAGVTDPQSPHAEDEIYVVVSGRGKVEIGGQRHPISPGSVISVPRHVAHKFVDVTEDLDLVVVFGPPEGSLRAAV